MNDCDCVGTGRRLDLLRTGRPWLRDARISSAWPSKAIGDASTPPRGAFGHGILIDALGALMVWREFFVRLFFLWREKACSLRLLTLPSRL
jgi:hypothetical protein